jgi:predicted transcriptional regulator
LNQHTIDTVIRLGRSGELQKNIAAECGISQTSVCLILKKAGVKSLGNRIPEEKLARMKQLNREGVRQLQLALELGVSQASVCRITSCRPHSTQ